MDQLGAMKIFTRVVETGSFSAVAREMNTGQPAISKQVAALEERLGVRLLNRTSRKLTLTEAGANYHEHCQSVLNEISDAEEMIQSLATTPRGRLRANVSVAFGRLHIAPYLPGFLERYPHITLDLSMNDRFVDLIAERVDVAIRIGPLADSSLVARNLGHSLLVVVGAPSYFAKHGRPAHPEDLKRHNCLIYTFLLSGNIWHFRDGDKELAIQVKGNCQSDNTDGIRDVIIAGTGLAMVPCWMVQAELNNGLLERALDKYMPWSSPISAVYPMSKYVPLKVRCFIDYLKEQFDKNALFKRTK
ncbi:MAG: LysR family transcriptional regulator [Desulfuromonadales bacterium]|nr:LysR family transcriptional regulator [Desulfuromonadales bacterium]